jgi:pyrroloquinoline quinone biosynthesis protein E
MSAELPTTLLAELTHRCPLHCPYCSNPIELVQAGRELPTADWLRVLEEARALGVLQLGLSGGEPLVRRDLETMSARAHALGFYTTLVTSGLGLTRARAEALRASGLDHIQLSLQDADTAVAERIAGVASVRQKETAAALIRELGFAFSINVVLHRANIDRVGALIELATALGADRLELANTQYYGWGLRNRATLMPSREQVAAAERTVRAARERHRGALRITYVLPDYHGIYPKPCYGGWGRSYLVVAPDGSVLPCHGASAITGMVFDNVRDRALDWIWRDSPAFRAYRGEDWMQAPCRSCARRAVDFGGCRCQAFALTGDAAATDPVCALAPGRPIIDAAVAKSVQEEEHEEYEYRGYPQAAGSSDRRSSVTR